MILRLVTNLLIEFGPIGVFFISVEIFHKSFIESTVIFVISTLIALIAGFIEQKRIALFPLIVGLVVLLFGLATIVFKNPNFLILKDTVYNGIFGIVLLGGLCFRKAYLKPLFEEIFSLTEKGWRILSLRWGILFILLAISNELVWYSTSNETRFVREMIWVHYKFWSVIVTTLFALYQFRLAKMYRAPEASPWGLRITEKPSSLKDTL